MQIRLKLALLSFGIGYSLAVVAAEKQRLNGHVHPAWARLEAIDRLPGTKEMTLAIGLPLRNRDALAKLLQQLCDPASATYHRYLTPDQFTESFGPTEQAYQAAINFAR